MLWYIYWYVKTDSKYMKNYDKNKEWSYLKYWDIKNLYGWILSQKLLLGGFKWVKEDSQFNKNFIKSYNDDGDEGCFLQIDVQYSETSHSLHNGLDFLLERMKIEKIEKLAGNGYD